MTRRFIVVLVALCGFTAIPGSAQDVRPEIGGLEMARADLEALLARNQEVLNSSAYSGSLRARARRDIELITARLDEGDYRVGDRVIVSVQGEWPTADTFTVEAGRQIVLPVFGDISLDGVLRSELEDHLTQELGRFIQQPVVRAETMIRMSFFGAVGRPGFYNVRSTMLVSEALMFVGGPSNTADLNDIRILRGNDEIWSGDELQEALNQGLTLDQMNLRAGDQLEVGEETSSRVWAYVLRIGVAVATVTLFGVRVLAR
jgi:protein involved in polysaccharide export with SLBB domain